MGSDSIEFSSGIQWSLTPLNSNEFRRSHRKQNGAALTAPHAYAGPSIASGTLYRRRRDHGRIPGRLMARLPRFTIAGQPQHVIQRGNNRTALFKAPADYRVFLR